MRQFPRPRVLASMCLEFGKVRHDGHYVRSDIVQDMMPFVDFIPVCPEVEIGLGVPRNPLRLVRMDNEDRLIMPETGEDYTDRMNSFADSFLDRLGDVDGFIFKGLSPSMGLDDARVYAKASMAPVVKRRAGLFAAKVIDRYPGYPAEENERLRNRHIREHFLTQLYTFAAFRELKTGLCLEDLANFHKNNRFLFMSYNTSITAEMSLLQGSGREKALIFEEYWSMLQQVMKKPGSAASNIEAAMALFATFGDITYEENSFFEDVLGRYAANRINRDAVIEILRLLAYRLTGDDSYEDCFLYPYPEELKGLSDEDRDKDYWENNLKDG